MDVIRWIERVKEPACGQSNSADGPFEAPRMERQQCMPMVQEEGAANDEHEYMLLQPHLCHAPGPRAILAGF